MDLVSNNIQKGRSSFALHGAARACLSDRIDVISFNAIGHKKPLSSFLLIYLPLFTLQERVSFSLQEI